MDHPQDEQSPPTVDPILNADESRFILHPVRYPQLWDAYKTAQSAFWTAEEIDLATDVQHWSGKLTDQERKLFSLLLGFFATSDGIINENLVQRFCSEVQVPEARCFYGFQIMMENVHAETYSLLLLTLVRDPEEQHRLFHSISTVPAIKAKADWCMRWIDDTSQPFAIRLVAFAAVEGIFFSSAFAAVFWLKSRGLMPGLGHSNELISRDEGLHTRFACLLHNHLRVKADNATILSVIKEAVELETAFFRDALPTRLPGMNAELMATYIAYIADRLLAQLGCKPYYMRDNPFPFMHAIGMDGRTNFFERRVSEYRTASVSDRHRGTAARTFTFDEAF